MKHSVASLLLLLPTTETIADTAVSSTLYGAFETIQDGIDLLLPDELTKNGSRVRLGAGFGTVPDYRGSSDYKLKVIPIIDIRYKKRLRLNYNRLEYDISPDGNWEFGPLIKYKSGRKETRHPILAGLGTVKATGQIGVFARFKTDRMLCSIDFRQSLSASQGSSLRASFGHALFKKGNFVLAGAVQGKWLSKTAMQTNFGVTAEQATNSKASLAMFETSAGVSELTTNLLGRYSINDKYRLLGLISYGRLVGDAANSPIVTTDGAGSRNQLKIGVGFTVDF